MVIRIAHSHIDPARLAEVQGEIVRIVEEEIIPTMRQLPGFQNYKGAVNRERGHLVSVSTWDSVEHANFESGGFRLGGGAVRALGVELDPPEVYEITTQS